jgi:hypothetical protein
MSRTWRDKSIGEMTGPELDEAIRVMSGMPLPRSDDQRPAFHVAWTVKTALELFSDQTDRDRWIIDWHLGAGDATADTRRLVELAIGRPVAEGEPRAPMSLLQEKRQRAKALFE